MKNLILCILLVSMAAVVGCSNNDSGTNNNGGGGNAADYMPSTSGSWWKYNTASDTARRSLGGSESYNGKTYQILIEDNSTGRDTSFAFRTEGTILYTVVPKDSVSFQEVTFLNTTVGSTWNYSFTLSIGFLDVTTQITGKTVAAGLTRKVNGKDYTDVLQIQNTVVSSFGSSTTNTYFAKGIGEIETVDPSGDKSETLTEYQIK